MSDPISTTDQPKAAQLDAVIVGAGFSGIYMLHLLREQGLDARVIEAGSGVGGTWHWNRYPGSRCDVESLMYSYSFSEELEQEWQWSARYATQPEILRYLDHVTDRFGLRSGMQFDTRVTAATFDEESARWLVETDRGDRVSARFCIMATGCISHPQIPDIEGIGTFAGESYYTALWPHEDVDLMGQKVAVIGTGSTGVQLIPVVAAVAEQLTVFQRTPNYAIPAWDGPLTSEAALEVKQQYPDLRSQARVTSTCWPLEVSETSALEPKRDEVIAELEKWWQEGGFGFLFAYSDFMTSPEANEIAAEFVRDKIRSRVDDPVVAELLCPDDHPFGTKRLCVDSDYYETYNRDNVTLVNVRETPIEEITPAGIRTADAEYDIDAIILATGFDAMTGALFNIDIRGRGGIALREKWAPGPQAYLGLGTAGFPNLFTITGPGSPSVLSNMVVSIEQHVEWVAECIAYLGTHGIGTIEAEAAAEEAWVEHVIEAAHETLLPQANSWYVGANVPGKPRVFTPYVGGCGAYRKKCDEVAARGYEGFALV